MFNFVLAIIFDLIKETKLETYRTKNMVFQTRNKKLLKLGPSPGFL